MDEGRAQEREAREDEVAGGGADGLAECWNELSHEEGDQPVEGSTEGGGHAL